jgi:DnaK suppressor protein
MAKKATHPAPAKATAKPPAKPLAKPPAKPQVKAQAKAPSATAKHAPSAPKSAHKAPAAKATPSPPPGRAARAASRAEASAQAETAAPAKNAQAAPNAAASRPRRGSPRAGRAKRDRTGFLAAQRQLLLEERATYLQSAEALKAQADSLALEHEPGDVQFDEEGGEGGTANVDREIDLHLSAQARLTVEEIDRALEKIGEGTYGLCEHCGQPIPDARLQALPYAALCVTCKSGGLSSRR